MSDYRFDARSKKQFRSDIKKGHIKEAEIAVRLCIKIHSETGNWPDLEPSGVDATGAFIEDIKEVNADPDFKIDGNLVEITRSDVVCNRVFHQKCHKIIKCLQGKSDLVFVNGYNEKQPKYLWLDSKTLEPFVTKSLTKYGEVNMMGGGKLGIIAKPAYRFDTYWFDQADLWKPLPVLFKGLPNKYTEILNAAKV